MSLRQHRPKQKRPRTHTAAQAARAHYLKRAVKRRAPIAMLEVDRVKDLICQNFSKGRRSTHSRKCFRFMVDGEDWLVIYSIKQQQPVTIYSIEDTTEFDDLNPIVIKS